MLKKKFDIDIDPYVIKDNTAYQYYKDAIHNFWDEDEIEMSQDIDDIQKLRKENPDVWRMLMMFLTFFAGGDNVVVECLSEYFTVKSTTKMDRIYREFQVAMENIHMITYGIAYQTYLTEEEQHEFNDWLKDSGIIVQMYKWAYKWTDVSEYLTDEEKEKLKGLGIGSEMCNWTHVKNKKHRARNLLASIINEGINFQGPFEGIFWFIAMFPNMIPGMEQFNELISRDETSHAKYSTYQYTKLKWEEKLSTEEVHEMFLEAIKLHMEFMKICLTDKKTGENLFEGFTYELVEEHIKHMANVYLHLMGEKSLFPGIKETPLIFASKRSLDVQSLFFEKKVTAYKRVDIEEGETADSFELTDDY